ncbi:polysaccharide deacetylase family protein [Falsiroseomonas selenitidurans]|uniref:Chitooligosaccharide deacetylase n=1 Tax=Falsiroseomonas selenitidurans TaxID=2716335 RepID=A0ABX1E083_9PROT|nr:polysaccharide deacetylase family protein [Falsiroseomonas selenitidurans]NKC30513.1 polysaccharide deacetylase family protein [Falsiroseomonas selenitidurans]
MRSHGRYGFSAIAHRPAWDWPNGTRLAVHVCVNLEAFPFAEGLGIPLVNPLPEPDVQNFGFRDWGNRVGVWNLLEALDEHAIPAAALLNTAIYDQCPAVAQAFRARGDECVGHGRTNAERQSDMDEATERAMILACRDRIAQEEGAPPRGWMGPWVSETHATPDLLAEAGFDYTLDWTHDDQPTLLATRGGGTLVSVPYSRPTNDIPALHAAKFTPADWAEMLIDQFEEQLRLSARWPLVFNLSLHPFLVGHPFRLRHLRRVLAHLAASRDAVWLCRPGEIARHARHVL